MNLAKTSTTPHNELSFAIIGSGIAGASCAYLLRAAYPSAKIHVIDSNSQPGQGASGNEIGLLYPRIEAEYSAAMRFYAEAWHIAVKHYRQLENNSGKRLMWHCGIVQLPRNDNDMARFGKIITKNTIAKLNLTARIIDKSAFLSECGAEINAEHALILPELPLVYPQRICEAMLAHSGASLILNTKVISLKKAPAPTLHCGKLCENTHANSELWRLRLAAAGMRPSSPLIDNNEPQQASELYSHIVIIANGPGARNLTIDHKAAEWSEIQQSLTPVRGQIDYLHSTPSSRGLRHAICGSGGYITPNLSGISAESNDMHIAGATYNYDNMDLTANLQDSEKNIRNFYANFPNNQQKTSVIKSRAAIRCVNRNRMPIYGEVTGAPGLFYSLAHGSRGLLSGIAVAEHLLQGAIGQRVDSHYAAKIKQSDVKQH